MFASHTGVTFFLSFIVAYFFSLVNRILSQITKTFYVHFERFMNRSNGYDKGMARFKGENDFNRKLLHVHNLDITFVANHAKSDINMQ